MNHLLAGAFALLLATQPFTAFASEPTAPLTDAFRQQIQASLQLPQFQGLSFVGVQILDSASGTELFSLNEHKLFVPASNAKLFSSAAALDVFGPDHTFATQVEFTGILA
ncbi:MAG: D-alanyl-D-alanine carboxypeptidase, partial [Candidatus Sumerlaeia bacterium]|nr:D-alanyl-D-alanine carboxypeptidase [Candidatus Sumerlaeia bacterium]